MSLKFGFKSSHRVTLSDISRRLFQRKGVQWEKVLGPADFFLSLQTRALHPESVTREVELRA